MWLNFSRKLVRPPFEILLLVWLIAAFVYLPASFAQQQEEPGRQPQETEETATPPTQAIEGTVRPSLALGILNLPFDICAAPSILPYPFEKAYQTALEFVQAFNAKTEKTEEMLKTKSKLLRKRTCQTRTEQDKLSGLIVYTRICSSGQERADLVRVETYNFWVKPLAADRTAVIFHLLEYQGGVGRDRLSATDRLYRVRMSWDLSKGREAHHAGAKE